MSGSSITAILEPLVKRGVFETPESAARELAQDYILRQIEHYRAVITSLEQKYGLNYDQFTQYLRQRAALLQSSTLSSEQRRMLNRAVMLEEEDALEWKVANEMLRSWFSLKGESEV